MKNSVAVVEVKKLPILIGLKKLNFNNERITGFHIQLLSEMFSNRKNKGILTDSNTAIFVEINLEKAKKKIKENEHALKEIKEIPLNYRVVDCHSSGLTLPGALTSFLYEDFENDSKENKAILYKIYQYLRKSDREYLTYLTSDAEEMIPIYKVIVNR